VLSIAHVSDSRQTGFSAPAEHTCEIKVGGFDGSHRNTRSSLVASSRGDTIGLTAVNF
jgi:hypothetical protein